jgi:hypothetical protein
VANEFVFHIRNAHPSDMAAALAVLDYQPHLNTVVEVIDQAESLGFTIRDRQRFEALMTARDLDLVEREENILTIQGRALGTIETNKPDLFADIVHGLQYTLWNSTIPHTNCFSWSYRTLCQMLWLSTTIDIRDRRHIASKVETEAREIFNRPDISLSSKSIGGALLWLSELKPAVTDSQVECFNQRAFCPPELFSLAVDFVYRQDGVDYGANLLLNDNRRDAICQVCLLEPTSFDRVLSYAVAQFDYLEKGLGGGWGHYLTLQRPPELADFV